MIRHTHNPSPARPWQRHQLEVTCDSCGSRAPGSRVQAASPLGPVLEDHAQLLAAKLGGFTRDGRLHTCPNCGGSGDAEDCWSW